MKAGIVALGITDIILPEQVIRFEK